MQLLHTSSTIAGMAASSQSSHSLKAASEVKIAAASECLSDIGPALHAAAAFIADGDIQSHGHQQLSCLPNVEGALADRSAALLHRAYLTAQMAFRVQGEALQLLHSTSALRCGREQRVHLGQSILPACWRSLTGWLFGAHAAIRLTWLAAMGDASFWQEGICIQQLCTGRTCCLLLPLKAFLLFLDVVAILSRVSPPHLPALLLTMPQVSIMFYSPDRRSSHVNLVDASRPCKFPNAAEATAQQSGKWSVAGNPDFHLSLRAVEVWRGLEAAADPAVQDHRSSGHIRLAQEVAEGHDGAPQRHLCEPCHSGG